MERKPRLWVGCDNAFCDQGNLTGACSANGKGYTSEMQIGELLLCVGAERRGARETSRIS